MTNPRKKPRQNPSAVWGRILQAEESYRQNRQPSNAPKAPIGTVVDPEDDFSPFG